MLRADRSEYFPQKDPVGFGMNFQMDISKHVAMLLADLAASSPKSFDSQTDITSGATRTD